MEWRRGVFYYNYFLSSRYIPWTQKGKRVRVAKGLMGHLLLEHIVDCWVAYSQRKHWIDHSIMETDLRLSRKMYNEQKRGIEGQGYKKEQEGIWLGYLGFLGKLLLFTHWTKTSPFDTRPWICTCCHLIVVDHIFFLVGKLVVGRNNIMVICLKQCKVAWVLLNLCMLVVSKAMCCFSLLVMSIL